MGMTLAPGIGLILRLARAGHGATGHGATGHGATGNAATGWFARALAVTSRQIPGHDPCDPQTILWILLHSSLSKKVSNGNGW
jgi:hypothetical protein